jgi:hypothetical protein
MERRERAGRGGAEEDGGDGLTITRKAGEATAAYIIGEEGRRGSVGTACRREVESQPAGCSR